MNRHDYPNMTERQPKHFSELDPDSKEIFWQIFIIELARHNQDLADDVEFELARRDEYGLLTNIGAARVTFARQQATKLSQEGKFPIPEALAVKSKELSTLSTNEVEAELDRIKVDPDWHKK